MLEEAGSLILEYSVYSIMEILPGHNINWKGLGHWSDYSPDVDLHN
jgi:hypothetical protein